METKQINLKLPENLLEAAQSYAKNFGFRNVQELTAESLREKVFEKNEFDETFTNKEIELIDELITLSIKNKLFSTEEEMNKILLE
ncbi:MAG: hypothetical protein ABIJ14_03170 [Nanoarchaeota archaeon]